MKYFLDTAKQSEIIKWNGFVEGVTSNPLLLENSKIDSYDFCIYNEPLFNNIFIQINSLKGVEYILNKEVPPKKVIFKVPLLITSGFDGFKLLKILNDMKLRTCATIVYDIFQFDYACEVGSEFSIVLYAKNENKNIVKECCYLKKKKEYKTKVVAASFRDVDAIFHCIKAGADYATVPPYIMRQLFSNEKAVHDYNEFYGVKNDNSCDNTSTFKFKSMSM